jgi:hypothetical protein
MVRASMTRKEKENGTKTKGGLMTITMIGVATVIRIGIEDAGYSVRH